MQKAKSRASLILSAVLAPINGSTNNQGDFRRLYNKRKKEERIKRNALITIISIQLVILLSFFIQSGGYPLGVAIACFLLLLNVCAIMIY